MLFRPTPSSSLVLLLAQVVLLTLNASAFVDHNANFPQAMALRAVVLTNTIPLAYYDEHTESPTIDRSFPHYHGFQPELLRHLQIIAKTLDNVTLSFDLEEAPAFSYTQQFEYLANNCNTTANRLSLEDCNRYDLVVGDYYGYPSRSIRTLLTPPILTTAAATVQYAHRQARQVSTLEEARALQEPVCLLKESHYDDQTVERFPGIHVEWCFNHTQCISLLKNEHCVLFVEDELQLRYMSVHDADLEVTREHFDEQYIVWPLRHSLDPLWQQLIIRWIYEAKVTGILDYLYHWYFSINYCPIGKAGVLCDLPCSPSKGLADRFGQCVCESIKWIGDDCSVEVMENKHLKSRAMAIVCYIMIGINFVNVAGCAIWMWVQRHTAQVTVAQPFFLGLVLLGCLVSTSTIFALGAQDEEDGPVRACMAIPWLYSVGFSITFGTLFGKIRRVYLLFRAAANMQHTTVSAQETILIIGSVLFVDITILTVWTCLDPMEWNRQILIMDQYGNPLESEGHCTSEHWIAFAGAIAGLHFALMGVACYLCYVARNIPTAFSESKYLTIAMISNLQIFVIGVPVLIILGTESEASIFVRSAIVWMNDFVVVTLIFGNLVYSVHWKRDNRSSDDRDRNNRSVFIRNAMDTYIANGQAAVQRSKSSSNQRGGEGSSGQDDHPTSSQLFSTYDGTNNAVLPSSPSPRVPQLPTLHHGLPTANINVNASPIMTVSESEGRLHVDTGGGKNIIVPITRVKFDCAVSEASDGLGPLRQLVQNWHDNAKETTKNLGVKDI